MRTLKYLAVFGIAALLLASCEKEKTGPSDQNKGKAKPTVAITKVAAADGELVFTLTPSADASQYGYAIFAGTDNAAPAPLDIVIDEVSRVEDSKVFNYADASSKTVTFECDSNTDYQVFAAAITSTGLLGEVSSLNVFVDDSVDPEIVWDEENGYSFDFDGSTLYVEFSEPVKYVDGKDVVATLFAGYGYDDTNIVPGYTLTVYPYIVGNPVGTAKATVSVDGSIAIFNFGKMTPGTFYTVAIPDGAFEDHAGHPAAGVTSKFNNPYFYKGSPAFANTVENDIWGRTDNAVLDVVLPDITDIDDLDAWIKIGVPSMVQRVQSTAALTTTIKHSEKVNGVVSESTTTYPMQPITHFGGDYYNLLVKPAGTPAPGDEITINVPAKAVVDIYGNENAAFVAGPFKYAYTPVYPVPGDYIVNNGDWPFKIRLVALGDDPEAGYALQADWFQLYGGFGNPTLYMTVDEPARTLTCNDEFIYNGSIRSGVFGSAFLYLDEEGTQLLVFWGGGDGGDPIVITYNDDGILETISYAEFGVHDAASGGYLGPFDYTEDGTTISPANTVAPTSVKTPRVPNMYELSTPVAGFAVRK